MALEFRGSIGRSPASSPNTEASVTPGKSTLVGQLDTASSFAAAPVARKAEAAPGGTRAHLGNLAEGSHPGIQRGGPGKRRIGHIVGGKFIRDTGATPAPAPSSPPAATRHEGARAYVGTPSVADRTISDGSIAIRLKNETDEQAEAVATAISMASMVLDRAIGRLGDPTSPKVATALTKNFHSTETAIVDRVRSTLQSIRSAFNATIAIEIEGADRDDARGFVPYEISGDVVIYGDIHLCPPWFADPDPVARLRTIIHECSHKFAGTDDVAYHWEGHYELLTPDDAVENADSYAWFCLEAF